jgi:hypothetical protein
MDEVARWKQACSTSSGGAAYSGKQCVRVKTNSAGERIAAARSNEQASMAGRIGKAGVDGGQRW